MIRVGSLYDLAAMKKDAADGKNRHDRPAAAGRNLTKPAA